MSDLINKIKKIKNIEFYNRENNEKVATWKGISLILFVVLVFTVCSYHFILEIS